MIVNCTQCGLELGQVFVFVDRHTRLCLDCAEQRTAAIGRHPAGKRIRNLRSSPQNPQNPQNPTRHLKQPPNPMKPPRSHPTSLNRRPTHG